MELTGHGMSMELPGGWEGRISRKRGDVELAELGGVTRPVAHLATFALPGDRGDFGSGAVDLAREDDAFVALVEYGPEAVNTPLFSQQGLPRRLDPRWFSPQALQRSLPPQVGWQTFFTEAGRAFCLYVVLGDGGEAHLLARRVGQVLAGVRIEGGR